MSNLRFDDHFHVWQLLAGRDYAKLDAEDASPISQMAVQMANYCYCVVDPSSGKALLVDPCWDVPGIFEAVSASSSSSSSSSPAVEVEACAFTHHHFDHTGGQLPKQMTRGRKVVVQGLLECARDFGVKDISVGAADKTKIAVQCRCNPKTLRGLEEGDTVWSSGHVTVKAWHTPGHTRGSICLLVETTSSGGDGGSALPTVLITGDTLFIGSCGRYDLPDSDVKDMLRSLERLSSLPADTVVLPGHNYAAPAHTTIGAERTTNGMMLQAIKFGPQLRAEAEAAAAEAALPPPAGRKGGEGGGGGRGRETPHPPRSATIQRRRGEAAARRTAHARAATARSSVVRLVPRGEGGGGGGGMRAASRRYIRATRRPTHISRRSRYMSNVQVWVSLSRQLGSLRSALACVPWALKEVKRDDNAVTGCSYSLHVRQYSVQCQFCS